MSKRGDTAQNEGPPKSPKEEVERSSKPRKRKASGSLRGTAKKDAEVRRNRQIVAERLAGRSVRSLAEQFPLSPRQIYDIVKEYREAGVTDLELGSPWRAQQFAEEHLLRLEEAINAARELELRAQEQNNASLQLGAFKQRIKLESDQTKFLQETGLMSAPRNLKFEAEVGHFWHAVNRAFDEHDIPYAVRAAISTTLTSAPGAERSPPPAHWLRSTHELEAGAQRERDAAERETAQAELLRQGEERREAKRRQEELKWHEEAQERSAAEKRKGSLCGDATRKRRSTSAVGRWKRPPRSRAWI